MKCLDKLVLFLVFCWAFPSHAVVVYDNLSSPDDVIISPIAVPNSEYGDQVTLAGSDRTLNRMSIGYRGDFLDHGFDGDEYVSIQFYENDGLGGSPGSQFYQSGMIQIASPLGTNDPQVFSDTLNWALPDVLAPDTFTWTLKFFGMTTASDTFGFMMGGDPAVGSSDDFLWLNYGLGWNKAEFTGTALANFHVSFEAASVPAPGTAFLLLAGLSGLWFTRRKIKICYLIVLNPPCYKQGEMRLMKA